MRPPDVGSVFGGPEKNLAILGLIPEACFEKPLVSQGGKISVEEQPFTFETRAGRGGVDKWGKRSANPVPIGLEAKSREFSHRASGSEYRILDLHDRARTAPALRLSSRQKERRVLLRALSG